MKKSSGLGGSVVSNNILRNKGKLKWCIKEKPVNALDNGWRFLSDIDTDEYLADASNMSICDWGTIIEIEPAIMYIFDMPLGTDITLLNENNTKSFVYTESGEKVMFK
ncbi:immunity protein Imm33 domain-containing protein [Sporosarcina psychrophila]|uniref:Immunity protein Imm33 domain-containing protein n=1 Tax=Sporosarcina psychrophila TaxID=1476 RepID=A0ABV2KDL8_SPOPS